MKRTSIPPTAAVVALLAALGGIALAAQDKYTLQVPGGMAFSEFRGYEDWQTIAVSQSGEMIETILGNPAMIEAYKAGIPGNGRPFPDGAKMAKIHWNAKKSAEAPAPTTVPDTLHDVDFMQKDSKRFADSGGWGYAAFVYDPASEAFRPGNLADSRRRRTTPSAGSRAIRSSRQRITFSRPTRSGEGAPPLEGGDRLASPISAASIASSRSSGE